MVLPLGAYAAGALAVVGLACRSLWRRLRAWLPARSRTPLALLLVAILLLVLAMVVLIVVLSPFAVLHAEEACRWRFSTTLDFLLC